MAQVIQDRRLTPATARLAHVSLRGQVEAEAWTEGKASQVALPLVDLLRTPDGARERQLALGEGFVVVDHAAGHAFGFAQKDGYCGWLPEVALRAVVPPTHWVASPGTHLYPEPRSSAREVDALPMGARVQVLAGVDKWAETPDGFVPFSHLRPVGDWLTDPVAVAERFLGVPYLWGGNSRAGMDCSGLVQMVFAACGVTVPGDADLQESAGREVGDGTLQRGDLLFWQGHVALIVDEVRLIHANGSTMSVAYEGTEACIQRIAAAGEGPVRARRRLSVETRPDESLINRPAGSP
ncbi:MAG: C40 family peptidase [Candidatus Saccharibacteria bacterium]|nr:C40 family peptidase [Pseudorhodobacter sp.]